MYTEDEINIIGLIPESELLDATNKEELKRIFYDALAIGPLYEPLIQDLHQKGMIDDRTGEIKQCDVVRALYSNSFLMSAPSVSVISCNLLGFSTCHPERPLPTSS